MYGKRTELLFWKIDFVIGICIVENVILDNKNFIYMKWFSCTCNRLLVQHALSNVEVEFELVELGMLNFGIVQAKPCAWILKLIGSWTFIIITTNKKKKGTDEDLDLVLKTTIVITVSEKILSALIECLYPDYSRYTA